MTELVRVVESVTVEVDDNVNYVCFIFLKQDGADQEGVQFQWADGEVSSTGIYFEVGGQQAGSYGAVRTIQRIGASVLIGLDARLAHGLTELQFDCSTVSPNLLDQAVTRIETVLRAC